MSNYEPPVFYLKVNIAFAFSFRTLQKWVYIAEAMNSQIFIMCDDEAFKANILKQVLFHDKPEFINSLVHDCPAEWKENCKNAYSAEEKWQRAALAHLTCFVHAKQNGIKNFWNIDADDTEIMLTTPYCVDALKKAENYAIKNQIDAFSFDMHSTRVKNKHWTWGVTFCRSEIDWIELFKMARNNKWHEYTNKFDDKVFNIDWYMTYCRDFKKANVQTFYIDKSYFVHYGMIPHCNSLVISVYHFKNGKLYFPFFDMATSKKTIFMKIPNSKDGRIVKITAGNTDKESKLEFLRRFLLTDGMIAGFLNFGLSEVAYDWQKKLFGMPLRKRIKHLLKIREFRWGGYK